MIISVASGKGGTGKTTVAVSLALTIGNAQIIDCDVEEPNVRLFLTPEIKETYQVNTLIPEIDKEKCTYCGYCSKICVYNALSVLKFEQGGEVFFFLIYVMDVEVVFYSVLKRLFILDSGL